MELYERVRPTDFDGVVGQDKAVKMIRGVIDRNGGTPGGKAFWITGPTGMGKTTLARIIASKMGAGVKVLEYSDPSLFTANELEQIHREYRLAARGLARATDTGQGGLFRLPTAVILNECHGLTSKQVLTLLGLLEPIPESFVWVFTTTWAGQNWLEDNQLDAAPLMGRCVGGAPIRLTNQGMATAAATLVREVAIKFGLDGQDLSKYVKLANEHKGSVRGMLQAVEAGVMLAGGGA